MLEGRFPRSVVRMNNTTETTAPAYYTPAFFEGEAYDEIVDILDDKGAEAATEYAAQWDISEDEAGPEGFRDGPYPHEREYGQYGVYSLIISRSVGYAYLVRDAQ